MATGDDDIQSVRPPRGIDRTALLTVRSHLSPQVLSKLPTVLALWKVQATNRLGIIRKEMVKILIGSIQKLLCQLVMFGLSVLHFLDPPTVQ